MSADAVVRLRIDKSEAARDLDGLDRRIDQSARSAQRSLGGGGGGSGVLGSILGASAGQLAGIGLAGQAFAPLVSDVSTITGGLLGNFGRGISQFFGLQGTASKIRSIDEAAGLTAGAVGGAPVDDATIKLILDGFRQITDPKHANIARIENIAGTEKQDEVLKRLDKMIELLIVIATVKTALGLIPGVGR